MCWCSGRIPVTTTFRIRTWWLLVRAQMCRKPFMCMTCSSYIAGLVPCPCVESPAVPRADTFTWTQVSCASDAARPQLTGNALFYGHGLFWSFGGLDSASNSVSDSMYTLDPGTACVRWLQEVCASRFAAAAAATPLRWVESQVSGTPVAQQQAKVVWAPDLSTAVVMCGVNAEGNTLSPPVTVFDTGSLKRHHTRAGCLRTPHVNAMCCSLCYVVQRAAAVQFTDSSRLCWPQHSGSVQPSRQLCYRAWLGQRGVALEPWYVEHEHA